MRQVYKDIILMVNFQFNWLFHRFYCTSYMYYNTELYKTSLVIDSTDILISNNYIYVGMSSQGCGVQN